MCNYFVIVCWRSHQISMLKRRESFYLALASLSRTERYIGDKATNKYGHSFTCILMGNQAACVTPS